MKKEKLQNVNNSLYLITTDIVWWQLMKIVKKFKRNGRKYENANNCSSS